MKEFALLFRRPNTYDVSKFTPTEMQALTKRWKDWVEDIGRQGKLVTNGLRLMQEGKVLQAGGVVTDGPFVEIREILGGLFVIKAENLEEAITLAHGCPALEINGSVEIRPVYE